MPRDMERMGMMAGTPTTRFNPLTLPETNSSLLKIGALDPPKPGVHIGNG